VVFEIPHPFIPNQTFLFIFGLKIDEQETDNDVFAMQEEQVTEQTTLLRMETIPD